MGAGPWAQMTPQGRSSRRRCAGPSQPPQFAALLGLFLVHQLLRRPDPTVRTFRIIPSTSHAKPRWISSVARTLLHCGSLVSKHRGDRWPHRPAILWIFPRGPQSAGKYTLCYLLASVVNSRLTSFIPTSQRRRLRRTSSVTLSWSWGLARGRTSPSALCLPGWGGQVSQPGGPGQGGGPGRPTASPGTRTGELKLVPPWRLSPVHPNATTSSTGVSHESTEGGQLSSGRCPGLTATSQCHSVILPLGRSEVLKCWLPRETAE